MRSFSLKTIAAAAVLSAAMGVTAFAAGNATSEYWYQSGSDWMIKDASGNVIKDSSVCDDKNNQNQDSNWYLMDSNGKMYEGVINDNGHYYLLDPNHSGTYGMMISGASTYNYNGVTLQLETAHNGYFGEIKNTDAISGLGLKTTNVNTAGKANLYTSGFGGAAVSQNNSAQAATSESTNNTDGDIDYAWTERFVASSKDISISGNKLTANLSDGKHTCLITADTVFDKADNNIGCVDFGDVNGFKQAIQNGFEAGLEIKNGILTYAIYDIN